MSERIRTIGCAVVGYGGVVALVAWAAWSVWSLPVKEQQLFQQVATWYVGGVAALGILGLLAGWVWGNSLTAPLRRWLGGHKTTLLVIVEGPIVGVAASKLIRSWPDIIRWKDVGWGEALYVVLMGYMLLGFLWFVSMAFCLWFLPVANLLYGSDSLDELRLQKFVHFDVSQPPRKEYLSYRPRDLVIDTVLGTVLVCALAVLLHP